MLQRDIVILNEILFVEDNLQLRSLKRRVVDKDSIFQ
jgi:hypothetical protein